MTGGRGAANGVQGGRMRIQRIEVGSVEVPLTGEFATKHSRRTSQRGVVVRVTAETGAVGWGSVEPTRGYSRFGIEEVEAAVRVVAPVLLEGDALNFLRAHEQMRPRCGVPEARAVVEMALFDLAGRVLGRPAWGFLGGAVRSVVRLNGWIGLVSPAEAASEAAGWAQRGFTSAKVKVGHDFKEDVARVAAVREAAGPGFEIRVDANEGLDVEGGIRLGQALERYDVALFEQPVRREDVEGLATIRRKIGIPIMADEGVEGPDSVVRLIRHDAVDLVKVKVMKQGGLLPTLETVHVAAAAGLRVVIGHGFGLWLSTMAEVHVAAAAPAVIDGLECVGPLKIRQDIVRVPPDCSRGEIRIPDAPGLGVEPDEALLHDLGWNPLALGEPPRPA